MGRRATAFFTPHWSIAWRASLRKGGMSASRWTESRSAPALAKASTYRPGFSTIRWTSRNRSVCLRMDSTTGTPMVMLGTNMPSITSTWSQSAEDTRRISRSRLQKSADKMEGAILSIFSSLLKVSLTELPYDTK